MTASARAPDASDRDASDRDASNPEALDREAFGVDGRRGPAAPLGVAGRLLALLLFFLSGAVSLAYEVAWSRSLLLLLGSTAAASTIVLGVFVGGLGLGARWGGRRAEQRERPLAFYGLLEVAAAAWAVLGVLLLPLLADPYIQLASGLPEGLRLVLRILLAVVVVLPAAFALGATLPAMVCHWVRGVDRTGRGTAWLYGINTLGAVLGCLATGFFLVPALGVHGVLYVSAAAGAAVGVVGWIAARASAARVRARADQEAPERPARELGLGLPAAVAMFCGAIGLAAEIVGFRVLVFFLEGFTVTFAAMLGVFILGLGAGSLVLGGWLARTERPGFVLGAVLVAAGLVLCFALFIQVPDLEATMRSVKADAYGAVTSPDDIAGALRHTALVGAFLLLFAPAFLFGPTFSLCVRWMERRGASPGQAVGRTYLLNSLGSLLGPVLGTFLLIPAFGVLGAFGFVAALALALGALLLLRIPERIRGATGRSLALGAPVLVALVVGVVGLPGTRPADLVEASVVLDGRWDRRLLDVRTDAFTTASVIEELGGELYLYTDDFAAAATGRHYRYMRLLGHLPALHADRVDNVMVIAFGTGTTAGAIAEHDDVKRLEVVELSQAVLDLAPHFHEANRDVLNDERVEVVRADGRNALLMHQPDLDVITLEPLMPYSPQGLHFYTREFYELARDRLREGGVLCQWIPVHAMPADLYAAFVRTFFEVFPEGSLWFFEQSSALIARKGGGAIDPAVLAQRLEAARGDLAAAGFNDPRLFASGYIARGEDILGAGPVAPGDRYASRPVTDDDPYPEFEPTPRAGLVVSYLPDTLAWLGALTERGSLSADGLGAESQRSRWRAGQREALDARRLEAQGRRLMTWLSRAQGQQITRPLTQALDVLDESAKRYADALEYLPGEGTLQRRRLSVLRASANLRVQAMLLLAAEHRRQDRGRAAADTLLEAEQIARQVLPPHAVDPEPAVTGRADAARRHAMVLLRLGRCAEAREVLVAAARALQGTRAGSLLANETLAALDRFVASGERAQGRDAWMFERAQACRAEDTSPVKMDLRRVIDGVRHNSPGLDVALRTLLMQARKHGTEMAVARALADLPESDSGTAAVRARLAALRLALGDRDAPFTAMLADDNEALRIAALGRIAPFKLGRQVVQYVVKPTADASHDYRSAFASAVSQIPHPDVPCLLVDLLLDPDARIAMIALTGIYREAPDLLEGFDPETPLAKRKVYVEKVARKLGCER